MTDSRKAEPAIQAYSSEKDFSRQGSPFCVGWGAWKNMKNHEKPWKTMKNHEKPYNRSFARGTFSYFKNQWILHPDFRNCTPIALRALPSVGGSSAMRNKKIQIWFVLNLWKDKPGAFPAGAGRSPSFRCWWIVSKECLTIVIYGKRI
mgnify:CR=1 FL=1